MSTPATRMRKKPVIGVVVAGGAGAGAVLSTFYVLSTCFFVHASIMNTKICDICI